MDWNWLSEIGLLFDIVGVVLLFNSPFFTARQRELETERIVEICVGYLEQLNHLDREQKRRAIYEPNGIYKVKVAERKKEMDELLKQDDQGRWRARLAVVLLAIGFALQLTEGVMTNQITFKQTPTEAVESGQKANEPSSPRNQPQPPAPPIEPDTVPPVE